MSDSTNFEHVDINSFFDEAPQDDLQKQEELSLLSDRERALINKFMPLVKEKDEERWKIFNERLHDLEQLANKHMINAYENMVKNGLHEIYAEKKNIEQE